MIRIRHCYYCGEQLSRRRATKDHIVPRSKGGSNEQTNIVDACRMCNSEKGRLSIDEFRLVMAFRKGHLKPVKTFRFPGELYSSI